MLYLYIFLSISELSIVQTTCGSISHYGVFADKMTIPKGTRFGPFTGKQVNTSEIKTYDDNTLMWEVSRSTFYVLIYLFRFICLSRPKYIR